MRTPQTVLIDRPYTPLQKRPLPPGRPRAWYVMHNRRLKAMRLAIALLDSGVYAPSYATNKRIRHTAEVIGIRPPSDATCAMVRTLMRRRY
ncbi:hypothetical protein ABZ894_29520 [Nocardia beijingensis]|uniref:hypothetical protein n=1 Tax=Nocardia TaxID=1817 RepID=UPI0012F5216D|nr:hypothetical protein [Nocardia beijingensis]MBF6077752.1 hypothetical protein [Nocardia beijingensis]